jgi:hypothetical protein
VTESTPENLSPNSAEASDGAKETSFRRKPRFTTLRGCRRELGSLYLDLMNGRVDRKVAGTAGNLINGIVRALEVELLEARVSEVEKRMGISEDELRQRNRRHGGSLN